MSKKPSYEGLALTIPGAIGTPAATPSERAVEVTDPSQIRRPKGSKRARPAARAESSQGSLRDRTQQVLVYLNPKFHKALRIYAAEADRKVHDLILEALEDLAKKCGIREKPRA